LTPVQVDGRLLVDGGLVDNLPVHLAGSMGVDRLIVVDVSFPARATRRPQLADRHHEPDDRHHGAAVARSNRSSCLRTSDVLIEPDLGAMTALEFARMPQGRR
jgi:NTE family protein